MKETKEVCDCLVSPDSQRSDEGNSESIVDTTRCTTRAEDARCRVEPWFWSQKDLNLYLSSTTHVTYSKDFMHLNLLPYLQNRMITTAILFILP